MKKWFASLLWIYAPALFANNPAVAEMSPETKQMVCVLVLDSCEQSQFIEIKHDERPNPVVQFFKKKQKLNKKITSAVLAFPFPFGMVGLHRIYLGTKPHVPVVYIATFGGVLGIIPLIDFFAIICDKNFDQYRDNGKIFMWLKD